MSPEVAPSLPLQAKANPKLDNYVDDAHSVNHLRVTYRVVAGACMQGCCEPQGRAQPAAAGQPTPSATTTWTTRTMSVTYI